MTGHSRTHLVEETLSEDHMRGFLMHTQTRQRKMPPPLVQEDHMAVLTFCHLLLPQVPHMTVVGVAGVFSLLAAWMTQTQLWLWIMSVRLY